MFKALRRLAATAALSLVALKAVGTFMSWLSHQDDAPAETWIDEEELEEV